jgi:Tfp pilus assembly major pilin PilA
MISRFSKGFSIIEVLVVAGVVVLLGGLGFVGWKAFTKSSHTAATTTSTPTRKSAEVITTKADLEAAEKALDELDFEDDSASQAESQASL